MQHDDLVYVRHMLDLATKAIGKIQGTDRESYDQDENLRMALAHLLQTFGEAARRTSRGFQIAHPEVPWARIIGMRHKVVHDYLDVNFDLVWDVVLIDLPAVAESLRKLLRK